VTRHGRRSTASILLFATVLFATSACAALAPSIPLGTPAAGASTAGAAGDDGSGSPAPSATVVPVAKVSAATRAVTQQLGIQLYWHTTGTTTQVDSAAAKVLDYIVGLGANSVSLTFPIYVDGPRPTRVYGVSGSTPSPATLDLVIRAAQARGLRVMLRPLIDETNLTDSEGDWRGSLEPPSVSGWFDSYRRFLTPYLQVAQKDSVNYFDIGVELDSLVYHSTEWSSLDAYAAGIFHGEIDYADNWSSWQQDGSYAPAAHMAVDAYPDVDLPDDASVSSLTNAWEDWLEHRSSSVLQDTVLQEVGIAAGSGAYHRPSAFAKVGSTVIPSIQVNWFDAACDAAKSLDMPGIYYWDVDSFADPSKGATSDQGSFIGRGDQAIKACFANGWNS
jgi:hypothetical protein